MATIVLSAAGAALGASIGGGVLGLSSVAIGRALGAIAGSAIDQKLMGDGSQAVETGRVDRFRVTSASEGTPIPRVWGRMRVGGQVIWASRIREAAETVDEGAGGGGLGKGVLTGTSAASDTVEYHYYQSFALGLCEGEIARVGRVWIDGTEVAMSDLNIRVYTGSETQAPDPKIEAVEGAGNVPAYRGTAYVVIEELDLTAYGNRIPVFNFEVIRPEQPDQASEIARGTKAVALIPGTGEYALATTTVHAGDLPGQKVPQNEHTPFGMTDFAVSLDMLEGELPNLEAVSLVVSWFGDDLRCATCEIAPKVEKNDGDGHEMPWTVSGLTRAGAGLVPFDDDSRPVYGGTPTDQSVIESIRAIGDAGKAVTFYPFVLMTQMAGNGLTDPWTGVGGQPVLPWRGRITTSLAPGVAGSPDGTAAAAAEVASFFGTVQPSDFALNGETVTYSGPAEWSYRRFILHYAWLCKAAGGVEAFLIGSELRGLTQIRGAADSFPVVAQLVQLAADVRGILGAGVKISYAADWSEYFGYHPADGSGDVFFHLDPLWADANIDFIGIDNYMPLSDWRDGDDHLDAGYGSIYNLDYLRANVLGGEGYDWFYASPADRDAQIRTPITDGAYSEPWVFRYKDLPNWWASRHHDRPGGVRSANPTAWMPGAKPIHFTEIGCAAIDRGTNQPNKFLDPKSSESSRPYYSSGKRDDFIQMQYLRALNGFWAEPGNNPSSGGTQMLDMSRAHVWAWDARPFPWFPAKTALWSDGENYNAGHWLNGRATNLSLAAVVEEICAEAGVAPVDTSALYGLLRGYGVSDVASARSALQPLMLAYGFDAAEREGELAFFTRTGRTDHVLDTAGLAVSAELDGDLELIRAPEAEVSGRVRLTFVEANGEYETRSTEAVHPDEATRGVSTSEVPLVLTKNEARAIVERWLAEARVARDAARFALPPSATGVRAGEVVALDLPGGAATFRVDHMERADVALVRALRVEPGLYEAPEMPETEDEVVDYTPPVPVLPTFMDLPLLTGEEVPHAPHLAVTADPWPGTVAVYRAPEDNGYALSAYVAAAARVGVTETALGAARPGLVDRGPALRVRMLSGTLASASLDRVLNGANLAAIGDGTTEAWEIIQFTDATLVGQNTWEITGRLRGQAGTDATAPASWPAGSMLVMLDGAVPQLKLPSSARGLDRHYRIGPAARSLDDATYVHEVHAFDGIGLRPFAPVHLDARWSGGDLAVSWIRRTRIDGDSWQSVEVPLGEDSESYIVRVLDGPTVLREATVTGPAWTYTAAMQTADGATAPFTLAVAQSSASFGAGPFRTRDVD